MKIRGPVVIISCTDCGEVYERNFSAFIESQFKPDTSLLARARMMIDLAKDIVERVGEEEAFKKKKKK
jgi:hypothetical protein